MALSSPRRTRWVWALLLLCALAFIAQAGLWQRDQRRNALIEQGAAISAQQAQQVPQLAFAQAHAMAAGGAEEAALQRYGVLQSNPQLASAARYNSANILMRQALRLHGTAAPGQALALVELAKENYRQVLRDNPGRWDARYNLERAQRLVPDPEDMDTGPPAQPQQAERAATTMRGYSPGLP